MKKISVILGLVMLVVALMAAWIPGPALAATSLTLSNLRLTPTYECLGVRVAFTGTPAVDGAAILEYRPSGGTWKTAFPMYCDILGKEFRGSIFWLSPNTTYEVRVTGANVVTGTVNTRNDNPASTGGTYYVSPSGSDSNTGTMASPWKTIGKAVGVVNPGDTVILRAGTYVGGFSITRSGTATNYITIKGADGETAILDGQGTNYNILDVSGSYIRIKNLTFQNNKYSTSDDSACVRMLGNSDCIVEDCTMQNGNGFSLCMLRNGAKNHLFQRLKWIMNKAPVNSMGDGGAGPITGGYYWKAGSGNVWRNIDITATVVPGIWDGFGGGPEDSEGYMDDTDIYNINVNQPPVTGTYDRDDGAQPEGSDINVRVWNMVCRDSFCGFANAPVLKGPLYFFRNTVSGFAESMLKCGNNSYGRMYFINNTAYTSNGGRGFKQSNSGMGNYYIRNNIIISERFTELNTITDPTNTKSPVCKTIDMDYDFVWVTGDKFMEFYAPADKSGASSWSGLQGVGLETHGINLADPKFVSTSNRDFRLASGSPCIDAGVVLTQFNDANSPWPYQGNAPDIGAHEYASGTTNNAPVINTIGDQSVTAGESITFTVSATSPSGSTLTYSASNLPSGATFNTLTKTFSWTPSSTQTGTYTGIHFQVTDGTVTTSQDISITVNSEAVNNAPVLSTIGNKTVTAGQALSFTVSATDSDGDTLTYSTSNLPSGAVFNTNTKAFSWTPSSTITGTYSGIRFQVSDGALTDYEDITITVNAAATNHAPVLGALGNKTVTAGQALSFAVSATDSDGDSLTYSASNLPSGAAFNASTKTFSWTPSSTITGTYSGIRFQVSDGKLTDYEDITITVSAASTPTTNQAPVIAAIGNKTVNEGQAVSFTVSADDADGDSLTYSAYSLPSGAAFNASTKTFSWTPSYTQSGTYSNVTFRVSDGSQSASQAITITVVNVNRAPVLSSIGNKSVTAGQALSFTVSATDPDGGTLTYDASNLPSGSAFNKSTRTFSWTPGSAQCGTYSSVRFQVSDGSLSDAKDATITVSTSSSTTGSSGSTDTSGSNTGSGSIFGLNSGDGLWYQGSDTLCASKFVNTSGTGTLTKLELLFTDSRARGKVRLGVYADDNGKPGALLLDAGEATIVNGWVSISGLNLPVTAGQSYWLAFNMNRAVRIKTQSNYGDTTFFWFNTPYGPLVSQFPAGGDGHGNGVYVIRATVITQP